MVQTEIRLLSKEQSAQVLHCLPFYLHILDALLHCKTKPLYFITIMTIILSVPVFGIFMITQYYWFKQYLFRKTITYKCTE